MDTLALTRLDGLGGVETLKIAMGYRDAAGNRMEFTSDALTLADAAPEYVSLNGFEYMEPAEWMRRWEKGGMKNLPSTARNYVQAIEDMTGVRVGIISVGPGREHKMLMPQQRAIFKSY